MIQEGLNIPNQETSMNILPELSDGLNLLLDQLVKSFQIPMKKHNLYGHIYKETGKKKLCLL